MTLIAQDPSGPVAAESLAPTTADHPPLLWPPALHTTTTAAIVATLGEIPGDSRGAASSRSSFSDSTTYKYIPLNFPSSSAPPTTSGALTPPASGTPESATVSALTPRAGAASSTGSTVSTSGPEHAGPIVSATEPTTKPLEMKTEPVGSPHVSSS